MTGMGCATQLPSQPPSKPAGPDFPCLIDEGADFEDGHLGGGGNSHPSA